MISLTGILDGQPIEGTSRATRETFLPIRKGCHPGLRSRLRMWDGEVLNPFGVELPGEDRMTIDGSG